MSYGYQRLRNRPGQSVRAVYGLREVSDLDLEAIVKRTSQPESYSPDRQLGRKLDENEPSVGETGRTVTATDTVPRYLHVYDADKDYKDTPNDNAKTCPELPITTAYKLGMLLGMKATARSMQETIHRQQRKNLRRISRPTTNSRDGCSPYRSSSKQVSKSPYSSFNLTSIGPHAKQITSTKYQAAENDTQIARRLQQWTEAFRNAVTRRSYDKIAWQQQQQQQLGQCMQRSNTEFLRRTGKTAPTISRSTKSALARSRNACGDIHVLIKKDIEPKSSSPRGNKKIVPVIDMESVVARVTTPTLATLGNQANCIKASRSSLIDEVEIRKRLPLLSGLERSADVAEVTNRLFGYSKQKCRPILQTPDTSA